jgi:glutamate:GABA antiporter
MTESTAAPRPPPRALGLLDVTLFMVTAGFSLQWTATAAATGASSLMVWVLGAIGMYVPLSVCVIFLAARYPDPGGMYGWCARAFGPFVGFMTGWTYWTGTLAYLPSVLYFAAGSALLAFHGSESGSASPAYFIVFSSVLLAIAVALNLYGMRVAKWLNSAGAVARWVGTTLLAGLAVAFWWRFGSATPLNRETLAPTFRLADVIFWSTLAFCWTGPEGASFINSEIRDPRRTVPKALILAAPMVAAMYIGGTASILLAIPPERASGLFGVIEAIRAAASELGLAWLIPFGAACLVLERMGSACLWMGVLARVPTASGVDRYLPASFTALHPRRRTPTVAIWTQAVLVALLVILGQSGTSTRGAYNVLVEMMVVGSMLPFLPLFGAAIRLSAEPLRADEVRIPGGRLTVVAAAVLGFATTLGSIVLAFLPPPEESRPAIAVLKVAATTAALLLAGAAFYIAGTLRVRRTMVRASPVVDA